MNKDVLPKRRKYNQWVANETLEDYALRYTAKKSRRWSAGWVANTALGVVSFLALEAIGGAITLDYGFTNAMWAIWVVGVIIFLSGLPISFYAARDGVDIDLLTRGAGFGYIGSTISSLVYASFTFIFFALEAAIMSMALNMVLGISLPIAYVISALVIIPLVTHGISRISLFQAWTQPVWLILQILPLVFIAIHEVGAFEQWLNFPGLTVDDSTSDMGVLQVGRNGFDLLLFGSAAAVIFPLIAQNGEQADFLRFLPEKTASNQTQWWLAVIGAGPGWVIFGVIKLFIGSFLAVLALNHGIIPSLASDPAHMYAMAFGYITSNPEIALWLTGVFVVISQLKINVTNAYAGSIAWGNFFSRLTHSHPGRVVWLFFNVAIALMLMELGLYQAFETILVTYACLVVAWVGSVVADLVINKPLGLSPAHIEFRRGHLYDINPVGVFSMLIASVVGICANIGLFGVMSQALAAFMSLLIPFVTVPLIAWLTQGKYYLCRHEGSEKCSELFPKLNSQLNFQQQSEYQCHVCENHFDQEDILHCPSYEGHVCSLCCALDSRCGDLCRPDAHLSTQMSSLLERIFPNFMVQTFHSMVGQFLAIFVITSGIIASLFVVVFYAQKDKSNADLLFISDTMWQIYFLLLIVTGILIWLYVLAQNSTRFALKERQLQTELLTKEVEAHEETAVQLSKARDTANIANRAKSRYLSGVSHELRTPLNTIFGYAQLMEGNANTDAKSKKIATVIKRSSEHLSDVIEGLLEISKIEARKLDLHRDKVDLKALIKQLEAMFQAQAIAKNIEFKVSFQTSVPHFVSVDEKRLRQILLNLLSNAIKFTPQGKVELLINYRNQVALFVIKDTGVGIAESDQERIFEPFERVHDAQSQTKQVSGTGLGLSISRLMIEMMGGNLMLQSQLNVGTEFSLKLFLPSVSLSEAEQERLSKQLQMNICGYAGARKQIMIVDDESNHRNLMKDLLQPMGFFVHLAESAEQALVLLKHHTIDLFLLDISMPGMNGWQLLNKLRQQGINEPVIIVSADPYTKEQIQQYNSDIEAYINKPVAFEKLLEQLQSSLELQWNTTDLKYDNVTEIKSTQNETESVSVESEQAELNLIPNKEIPNKEILISLKEYAQIGYLKGVLDCIEQIKMDSIEIEWVNQLKVHSEQCNLNEIVRLINEHNNTNNNTNNNTEIDKPETKA